MDGFRVGLSMRWGGFLTKPITYREYRFLEGCCTSNCLHNVYMRNTAMERAGEKLRNLLILMVLRTGIEPVRP
jgi:hypothetical protein